MNTGEKVGLKIFHIVNNAKGSILPEHHPNIVTERILAIPEILIKAEDQSLPNPKCLPSLANENTKLISVEVYSWWDKEALIDYIARANQQDMLNNNWVKVEK